MDNINDINAANEPDEITEDSASFIPEKVQIRPLDAAKCKEHPIESHFLNNAPGVDTKSSRAEQGDRTVQKSPKRVVEKNSNSAETKCLAQSNCEDVLSASINNSNLEKPFCKVDLTNGIGTSKKDLRDSTSPAEEIKEKKMAYDDIILHMGEFGRYQRRIYLLLCLPAISCALHKMSGVFLGANPDFRCLLPHEDPANSTFQLPENIRNFTIPWDTKTRRWSQCERYDLNVTDPQYALDGNYTTKPPSVACESYVYDRSLYQSSTTSEWNHVCDKAWLTATGDSLFMVGVMLGSMVFGALSDKYGRRPIFFLSLVIQLVCGVLVAVSPEYVSYVIFRLILGSTTSGVFLVAYVIALEMVGPQKRLVAGVGCQLFFTTGYILTTAFAYFLTNWRYFQIAITIPSLIFLSYWWFVPESARWLLTKGRKDEAKELLQKASMENGVELPESTLDSLLINDVSSKSETKEPSLFDLIRYPNLRKKSLLLFFNWFVNSGTYYGLSWNTSNLGGNDYVNFVVGGFVEIPAYTFLLFTLNRWGRKVILCGCMLFAGTVLLLTIFVPADMQWLTILLAMLGKMAITSSYGAVYVFTAEQFPTVIRNVGLGACSTFARVGGVIAPYINHLAKIWVPLPLVIFGFCAFIGGLMSLLLPETLNKTLPETIEDSEQFGKRISKKKAHLDQLNDIESMKPLKVQANGVYEKQNG